MPLTGRFIKVACLGALLFASCAPARAATVAINGAQTYQVIAGFGANINHRSWTNSELEPVLDAMVDQAGMTLFRVIYDNANWERTNDNSDPDVMNWTYYNEVYSSPEFEKLWGLSAYLNQKGITNGLIFNFQCYGPAWMLQADGFTLAPGYEDEWAEMIASVLIYARTNRHLQFALVEPDNEPEFTSQIEGILMTNSAQYVTALHYLAQKLDTNGLGDLRFVGPDMAYTQTSWWTAIMNDPVVMAKLAHFGLHSYVQDGGNYDDGGQSDPISAFLRGSAYPGSDFWVTEFNVYCLTCAEGLGNTYNWEYFRGTAEYLLAHLANGASAGIVWEGYDGYYLATSADNNFYLSPWGLFALNNPGTAPETYTPRKNFYTVAQISKYVHPGAQRIGVSGSLSPLVLLAFYQTNTGQLTLTGVNSATSPVALSGTLANLPPLASLELYYTDNSTNLCDKGTIWLTNGAFQVTVPADCVFTLTGFSTAISPVSVAITTPVNGATYSAPAAIPIQASASTTTGAISTVVYFNGTNQLGQATVPPYSFVWNSVALGAYVLTAVATNSVGASGVSAGVNITVTDPAATAITLTASPNPSLPGQNVTFTATVTAVPSIVGTPTGTVQFKTNGVALCAPVTLDGSGVAKLITNSLPHGSSTLFAEYAGNSSFLGSTNSVVQVVNTPPAAGTYFLVTTLNTPLSISAGALAALDYDADSDPLTITAVSSTSTNGPAGNVTLTSGTIQYTPAAGYVGADQFTCTISDGYGGTATCTNHVTVRLVKAASVFTYVSTPVNNRVDLRGYGIPGNSYDVQKSSDLVSWTTISLTPVTAAANGIILFTDPNASTSPRYYRFAVH